MEYDSCTKEMQSFYDFLGKRIENGASLTPESSVREFRLYQEELRRFLAESQAAFEQAHRNEGRPLDVDTLMGRVNGRIAKERADS